MAQTIKHRRGKLESIAGSVTPVNGELIIASGSDLAVHQEGLLFVGVEGNVLTPSNKILTGSATLDVTGGSYDHSIDGVPYYETDAKKLTILGKGGNTDVTLAHGQIDFQGSGIVSSSAQVGVNDNTITITAGDGLKTGGSFTTNDSSNQEITLNIDVDVMAGAGLVADNTNEELDVNVDDSSIEISSDALRVKASGVTNAMLANSTISGVSLGSNLNSLSAAANGGISLTSFNGSAAVTNLQLDIDGMTDIGAALADADLMIVDDGAGGTNRKATMSRLKTYMQNNLSFSSGDITSVVAGEGINGGGTSGDVTIHVDSGSLAGAGLTADDAGAINVIAGNLIDVQANQVDVDLSELTDMTQAWTTGEDEFVVLDDGTQKRKLSSEIFGSNAFTSTTIGTTTNALTVDDSSLELNSGTTFNGSAARTISVKDGGITNDMLAGSIANGKLANDGITIGTTDTSLGDTITALVGLTDLDLTAGNKTIFDTVGSNTLTMGASGTTISIPGNLTVSGTTTYIDTTNLAIGDNIIELNAAGTADGGIYVRDAEGGTTVTGSLIWNTGDDRWTGGAKGSEKILTFYNASPTTNTILKANASDLLVDSAITDNGSVVTISSNLIISGLSASQLVVTNGSKQLTSSTDISSLTLTLDGGEF
tara:strand:- start:5648 stop:7606 length:1959 start_codon:yes stop_codon:yes gene_type:complete